MNISEGLLLLLITDSGGKEPLIMAHDQALAAGVLADLALGGHITVTEEKKPKIEIIESAPAPEHPALAAALAVLKEKAPVPVATAVNARWFRHRNEIGEALAQRGIVRVDESSFLFFTSVKHPTVDGESEELLRKRLVEVLMGNAQPDAVEAMILGILKSIDAVRPLLKKDIEAAGGNARKRELHARIDELPQEVDGLSDQLQRVFSELFILFYVLPVAIGVSAGAGS